MTHRIDIEAAVGEAVAALLEDPDGRDTVTERDNLLAIIYGWQQEVETDRRREAEPADVSVQPDWARRLPIQQQSVLMLAARGPDGMRKHHPAKDVIRAYRACVLHAASAARPLRVSEEGDSFMSASYLRPFAWGKAMEAFFWHVDEIPHHYLLHLLHAAEILAYHHPSKFIRDQWGTFYLMGCDDMHLPCETRETMDARLNDFGRSNGGRQWCLGDSACDDDEHSVRCTQARSDVATFGRVVERGLPVP